MDIGLVYDSTRGIYDIALDGADLRADETLTSAVICSLMCDRLAAPHEVDRGADRRGWWADAFATIASDKFGSRLWLLEREKQITATLDRCKAYCQEALHWLVDDGAADRVSVAVFAPRMGWMVARIEIGLASDSTVYRFEWDDSAQVWRVAQEGFEGVGLGGARAL